MLDEKAIAGLLAEHGRWREDGYTRCECGIAFNDDDEHRAHVGSVIAAHMAAPDELTALTGIPERPPMTEERLAELDVNWHESEGTYMVAVIEELVAEVRRANGWAKP